MPLVKLAVVLSLLDRLLRVIEPNADVSVILLLPLRASAEIVLPPPVMFLLADMFMPKIVLVPTATPAVDPVPVEERVCTSPLREMKLDDSDKLDRFATMSMLPALPAATPPLAASTPLARVIDPPKSTMLPPFPVELTFKPAPFWMVMEPEFKNS